MTDSDCADQDRWAVHHFRVFRVFRGQPLRYVAIGE